VSDLVQQRIETALKECETHLARLEGAAVRLTDSFPLTETSLKEMPEETITVLDQFIYRFTKLQDAIGTRLFPAMAVAIIGDQEPRPFLDILGRLEKAGALTSVETWQSLRVLRNNLAHEYPDSVAQCADTLNLLHADWRQLLTIFTTARQYHVDRLRPLWEEQAEAS
jgi:hypothetical protein